jgi:adenylate kinase family enzyme
VATHPQFSAEVAERAEAAKEELAEARANLENNGGRYGDDLLVKWFKETLASQACRNQGYVLDGFPKTMAQANELFGVGEDRNMETMPSKQSHLYCSPVRNNCIPIWLTFRRLCFCPRCYRRIFEGAHHGAA